MWKNIDGRGAVNKCALLTYNACLGRLQVMDYNVASRLNSYQGLDGRLFILDAITHNLICFPS